MQSLHEGRPPPLHHLLVRLAGDGVHLLGLVGFVAVFDRCEIREFDGQHLSGGHLHRARYGNDGGPPIPSDPALTHCADGPVVLLSPSLLDHWRWSTRGWSRGGLADLGRMAAALDLTFPSWKHLHLLYSPLAYPACRGSPLAWFAPLAGEAEEEGCSGLSRGTAF